MLCDARRVIFPVPVILNRFTAVLLVFSFGILLLAPSIRLGHQYHDHQFAIESGSTLHYCKVLHVIGKGFQFSTAELGVSNLTSLEHTGDLNLMTLIKELYSLVHLSRKIVFRNSRTDLYTLYVKLFAFLVLAQLAFEVLVLPVVDDLADGGSGGVGNHNEVEPIVFGHRQRLPTLHDSKLLALWADHSDVSILQHATVDFWAWLLSWGSSKSCYVLSPVELLGFSPTLEYILACSHPQSRRNFPRATLKWEYQPY